MSRLSNFYLLTYNSVQAFGWYVSFFSPYLLIFFCRHGSVFLVGRTISLYRLLDNFVATKSTSGAYSSVGELICFLQTAAFLEIIHGAIGLVPTGVLLPLMQWGGRVHFLVAVVRQLHEVQQLPSVFITFLAWSLSEVIRYSHHALNCLGVGLFWLTYLRYTAFIILYPIGVTIGEMWLMYQAIPFMIKNNLYADAFSYLPFSYYNAIKVLLFVYPLFFLKLYLHLFKQRKSKLGKQHKKKRN
ncbi:very-long-chain (3R)-3-hydroxyacyl-CoA dehydratase 2 isoform X1 [Cucurbita maxima]|uniref:Very-long-chain (3R)-3-hydroxyacyl-CoA dehydratase n=1 Tax=Cucurbita maxima TaxID=3661 RepID=A0A6J1KZE6_CUCMA|nr:very-long-chain (3R)-3-hydroxyacyl-CoA dehydratase 2 isoform X1 [Cucurbita maxima]